MKKIMMALTLCLVSVAVSAQWFDAEILGVPLNSDFMTFESEITAKNPKLMLEEDAETQIADIAGPIEIYGRKCNLYVREGNSNRIGSVTLYYRIQGKYKKQDPEEFAKLLISNNLKATIMEDEEHTWEQSGDVSYRINYGLSKKTEKGEEFWGTLTIIMCSNPDVCSKEDMETVEITFSPENIFFERYKGNK